MTSRTALGGGKKTLPNRAKAFAPTSKTKTRERRHDQSYSFARGIKKKEKPFLSPFQPSPEEEKTEPSSPNTQREGDEKNSTPITHGKSRKSQRPSFSPRSPCGKRHPSFPSAPPRMGKSIRLRQVTGEGKRDTHFRTRGRERKGKNRPAHHRLQLCEDRKTTEEKKKSKFSSSRQASGESKGGA